MAEKKKKKSKFKKILKTLGKVAALGAAGYGAAKLFGGRKGPTGGFLKSGAAGGASLRDPLPPAHLGLKPYKKSPLPEHLTPDMGASAYVPSYAERAKKYRPLPKIYAGEQEFLPDFKHGGRVTGIAKRGFGRALMKGKK